MSAGTIFLIAGIAGVFGFGRDIIGLLFKSRKIMTEGQSRASREPFELNNIILNSTKEAVDLQAAMMVELRVSLEEERKARVMAVAEAAALKVQLEATKQDLYSALLRAHKES